MIKIDFQKFMYDHVWFGWWYAAEAVDDQN
jgi:hypothetical protein